MRFNGENTLATQVPYKAAPNIEQLAGPPTNFHCFWTEGVEEAPAVVQRAQPITMLALSLSRFGAQPRNARRSRAVVSNNLCKDGGPSGRCLLALRQFHCTTIRSVGFRVHGEVSLF
jgi:hypothetical protein